MLFKIAIKNLLGARLRTILNVFVTSFSFFIILLMSGMYDGMLQHAKNVTIDTEIAGGAYWNPNYDPLDPMSFEDAHSIIPNEIKDNPFLTAALVAGGDYALNEGKLSKGVLFSKLLKSEPCLFISEFPLKSLH